MQKKAKYWFKLILFFCVTLYLAVILVFPIAGASSSIHNAKSDICCQTPADLGFEYEDVAFQTTDGITLRGWFIPSSNGAVIITLHGYGTNRMGTLSQAALLADDGYGVLLYDQRASGQSDGEMLSWGWRDVSDVGDAVRYLRSRPDAQASRIGVYGCSTGAEIALASTAFEDEITAVAAEDAEYTTAKDIPKTIPFFEKFPWPTYSLFIKYMEWLSGAHAPITLSEAVKAISPRSLLLISNGQTHDYWQAEYYYALAHDPKTHWNIPESTHCGGIVNRPEEYQKTLRDFFDKAYNINEEDMCCSK